MTRWRALAALALVVGGLVAMSLSTIVAGTETAPAIYATVSAGSRTLDIWRDTATRDLTFHWEDANQSVALRYIPARLTVAQLSGGKNIAATRYASSAAAWRAIHKLYGVTRRNVHAALLVGTPSPAAPTAGVKLR